MTSGLWPASRIDNAFAVFLDEIAALGRQQIDHLLRWPAETHTIRCDHDGPVDKYGMRHHGVQELLVGQALVREAQFVKRSALLRNRARTGIPMRAISCWRSGRAGGVLRYSMM